MAAALPLILQAFSEDYYIGFATRLLIFVLAATGLNFIQYGWLTGLGVGLIAVALIMGITADDR